MNIITNTNSRTIQKSNHYKNFSVMPPVVANRKIHLPINWKEEDNYFKTDADRRLCASTKISFYKSSYIDSIRF